MSDETFASDAEREQGDARLHYHSFFWGSPSLIS